MKNEFNYIKKKIKKANQIYIIGHKFIDLDAYGAAIGMYYYIINLKKRSRIILDDTKLESSVKKVINMFSDKVDIVKSKNIDVVDDKDLLIIVDTNKQNLISNVKLLSKFNNIIIIDHHKVDENTISNDKTYQFIDTTASSTCEIITKQLILENISINKLISTALLSGIVLDTNNFTLRTNSDTYYCAYYLSRCGADSKMVQYILKQNINEYINIQKVITDVNVIKNVAFSKGLQTQVYRREELAKIADTLLLFNNIEASFVVGKVSGGIGISARSMGKIDVGTILNKFNGGGDIHEAAAIIEDSSLNKVYSDVVDSIKKIKNS